MIWTEDHTATIVRMHRHDGMSLTQIANHYRGLGYADVTRNAVVGCIRRFEKKRQNNQGCAKHGCDTWSDRVFLPWPAYREWRRQQRIENAVR